MPLDGRGNTSTPLDGRRHLPERFGGYFAEPKCHKWPSPRYLFGGAWIVQDEQVPASRSSA